MTGEDERALVDLNFVERATSFDLPDDVEHDGAELLLADYGTDETCEPDDPSTLDLRPYEARIYRLA